MYQASQEMKPAKTTAIREEPRVERMMNELGYNLSSLEESLMELKVRLQPVIKPKEVNEATGIAGSEPSPMLLSDRIEGQSLRASRIKMIVVDMLQNMEI